MEVKIIKDSVSETGVRLTTFALTYPRFLHPQYLTHRMFSRNAQSSRAFPTKKLIEKVRTDPTMPVEWGINQRGMVAGELLSGDMLLAAKANWMLAASSAAQYAEALSKLGVHKQIVNRVLEPFMYITTLCTATEWDNFWELRCASDAQPEFTALAKGMLVLYLNNIPNILPRGHWHLPFITAEDEDECTLDVLQQVSVARCARVSYLSHEGTREISKDIELFEHLVSGHPHLSPLEHVATPMLNGTEFSGNLRGWVQYRKILEVLSKHNDRGNDGV